MSPWNLQPQILYLDIWADAKTCRFLLEGCGQRHEGVAPYPPLIHHLYDEWLVEDEAFWLEQNPKSNTANTSSHKSSWSPLLNKEEKLLTELSKGIVDSGGLNTIRQAIRQCLKEYDAIELRIACRSYEIERLPWEAVDWGLDKFDELRQSGRFRIIRTVLEQNSRSLPKTRPRTGKSRVLLILGLPSEGGDGAESEERDPFRGLWRSIQNIGARANGQSSSRSPDRTGQSGQSDLQSLNLLKLEGLIDLETIQWSFDRSASQVIKSLFTALQDERGWDAIVFAGHSCSLKVEGTTQGGTIVIEQLPEEIEENQADTAQNRIRPRIELDTRELAFFLKKVRGLKLMMFNSCDGLGIAKFLLEKVKIPQIVVMRERVWSTVAQQFLKVVCQSLGKHESIAQAVETARQALSQKSEEFPSGYLLPSIFVPRQFSGPEFSLKRSPLQEFWFTWRPSRWQAAVASVALLLGMQWQIQDRLMDNRQALQLPYRILTGQSSLYKSTRILVVTVTQKDINQAIESNLVDKPDAAGPFQDDPFDRRYLAILVDRAAELGIPITGIDYTLALPGEYPEVLNRSIRRAVSGQQSVIVLAEDSHHSESVSPKIASPKWTLSGDVNFYGWLYPSACELDEGTCSFPYWIALVSLLGEQSELLRPAAVAILEGEDSSDLKEYIIDADLRPSAINQSFEVASRHVDSPQKLLPGTRHVLDLSLRPDTVFERVSASNFLDEAIEDDNYDIVIIGAGSYRRPDLTGDQDPGEILVPLPVRWGRRWQPDRPSTSETESSASSQFEFNRSYFTLAEAHAYMVTQLIHQHHLAVIADGWMIAVAALVGKIVVVIVAQQPTLRNQKPFRYFLSTQTLYIVVALQLYVSAGISIPILLPSVVFWLYVYPQLRRIHRVYPA